MPQRLSWSINLNPARLSSAGVGDDLYRRGDQAREQLLDLGVSCVRLDLRWALLEPRNGHLDPDAIAWYRHFIKSLTDAGLSVYAILYNPPQWACDLSTTDLEGFHAAWRQFCRLCAWEFGDRIQIWQVWNEPNNYVSHLKDDFNLFETRNFGFGGWKITLPVGVRWNALVPLFRIARQELGPDALLVYNVIASVSDFTPLTYPGWTEWDHFTERFLEAAGDVVDAIALDHYPDTWSPGSGPLAWEPLDVLYQKVHDPRTAWYGKTVLIGEFGYSSCPNVDLVKRPTPIRFFPEDHSEEGMAQWFAAVVPHLQEKMAPERWPHNKIHLANVYELYDGTPQQIMGGSHAEVIGLEYYFGLLRSDHSPKPAYTWLRGYLNGEVTAPVPSARKSTTNPLGLYMKGSAASRAVHRRISPMIYALYQALRPPLRRHDAGVVSMGAVLLLYNLWRATTRTTSK